MEECEKYGKILEMKIPRPTGGSRQSTGVGKIYIKYEDAESAKNALQALAGRKFADRTVVTTYFDEVGDNATRWNADADYFYRPVSTSMLGKLGVVDSFDLWTSIYPSMTEEELDQESVQVAVWAPNTCCRAPSCLVSVPLCGTALDRQQLLSKSPSEGVE